ncbi:hypothetical protein OSJ77_09570 [Phyllobacterium sp. 0TCS1.6C]|jgi:hypothetical protein|uniref:hypothetical protein n=1 Tax=unclassified Phyllobacterium TaxID=2638441 RepID=UPI002263F5E0|nr:MULTISPECIES: hypothetical protein [unclassified Phyllobacterium]MCX8280440.1 hypothetical protein [Phyllobacterium sp. 0TCS1.6C]MCX8295111.1 hypothetical protein [Phyllobacterium sp. 0TCS1.6A]
MIEHVNEATREQLQALKALDRLRNNEIQKYVAAALDRFSTAAAVIGVLTPVTNMITTGVGPRSQIAVMVGSALLSTVFHACGRLVLNKGLE